MAIDHLLDAFRRLLTDLNLQVRLLILHLPTEFIYVNGFFNKPRKDITALTCI